MRNLFIIPFLLTGLSGLLFTPFRLYSQAGRPIGINLTSVVDWSSEYVFVDVFKQSRQWISHEAGWDKPWSSGVEIPLDTNGYPLEIPWDNGIDPPQLIRTLMYFGDLNSHYPGGAYRLIASGNGQIRLWGAATGTFTCPVDTQVMVFPESGGIALEIERSDISDPVTEISFVMPGHFTSFETLPFHPELLDFLKDFQVIRFMDWLKTNDSPMTDWEDRSRPDQYTQTLDKGVSFEYLTALCNQEKKSPWICIPHQATDDYIRQLAQFMEAELDPSLDLYIEYSNEVWNGIFAQNSYSQQKGHEMGYSGEAWEKGWKYYVRRTMDIFSLFEEVFDDDSRLKKVLSGQSANSWLNNRLLEYSRQALYNPYGVMPDAFAIAPYFGGRVADAIGQAGMIGMVSVEDIIDSLEHSLPESFEAMDANKSLADQYDLELIAYEGGQHLVAGFAYHNDPDWVELLEATNRHARMKDLYCAYFDHWFSITQASLMCHFSSHGPFGKYGSWGIKEFYDDWASPKYLALKDCVFEYNPVNAWMPYRPDTQLLHPYPNPSPDGTLFLETNMIPDEIRVYDLSGRQLPATWWVEKPGLIGLRADGRGMLMAILAHEGKASQIRWIRP